MYSRREELAHSLSHGLGLVASVVGLVVIVDLAAGSGEGRRVAVVGVFAATLILTYLASTLYHAARRPRLKAVLRRLDHAAIALLIAGTYTPVALAVIGGGRGLGLAVAIWVLAATSIAAEVAGCARRLAIALYLVMGWLVVVVAGPLVAALAPSDLALVLAGGVAYTAGVPFYLRRSLPFGHLVWHLFVLTGSVCHYLAILRSVALA